MIKKLFEMGYFDYQGFILGNLKNLSLSTTEALVLIKVIDNYKTSSSFNPESIREKMNIRKDSFDNALASLLDRKLYEIYLSYDNGIASEAISLDGFFESVENILDNKQVFDEDETHSIIMFVTKEFNRNLSSNELEILKSLISDDRYTKKDFLNAVDKIKENNKILNIRNLSNELSKGNGVTKTKKETPEYVKDFIKRIK
ncbi:MAG: hypothetical protein IKP77_00245 [Acholeplasmatales bacterium]|nr:hypothetical protein [Acholeplasmatales bacterium]